MLGEVIHGYRVDRELAGDKGGFGDVFFATHVGSGAEAVVKVLKPEMSAMREIVGRFFNEARAAASVHHPGIVQIHNVGYHRDRAYLLMERLRGEDLEARVAAGPLPLDRAVIFMRQAAGAVGAAHERGIVHRDLKPANLFVVADPDVVGGERVKVLDFGIAKLTADSGGGSTQGVFGTPAYMSPEQCASTGAVDCRADLYSLGCIFFELVCGRPPFGHGGLELIASHLRDAPPSPRALAPWLPPVVEQIILGLLEKHPARRISSCAELVAALDEAAQGGLIGLGGQQLSGAIPIVQAATMRGAARSTLGAAAVAMTSRPQRRRHGQWLGLSGAVVAVVVTVVVVRGSRREASDAAANPREAAVERSSAGGSAAVAPGTPARAGHADEPQEQQATTAGGIATAAPPSDIAASDLALAAALNDEGKRLMLNHNPNEAADRFRLAFEMSKDPRYRYNLARALYYQGAFFEAQAAARAVLSTPSLAAKARDALLAIEVAAKGARDPVAADP